MVLYDISELFEVEGLSCKTCTFLTFYVFFDGIIFSSKNEDYEILNSRALEHLSIFPSRIIIKGDTLTPGNQLEIQWHHSSAYRILKTRSIRRRCRCTINAIVPDAHHVNRDKWVIIAARVDLNDSRCRYKRHRWPEAVGNGRAILLALCDLDATSSWATQKWQVCRRCGEIGDCDVNWLCLADGVLSLDVSTAKVKAVR